jgi:MFS family permease
VTPSRPWIAFSLLTAAFFMVNLDFSIVSIALPAMQSGLHISPEISQWILSVYAMVFAGFLMLSGSFADVLGRRRFFVIGVALFGAASLAGGFANDATTLIAMRALQGLGAAMCNPAGLAIATTLFSPGPARNKAVGFWAASGAAGVVFGMLLGGVLVGFFSWRAVLWVNVPVCALLLVLVPFFVPREASLPAKPKLDVGGAAALTATLLLLTFTIVRIPEDGVLSNVTALRAIGTFALFLFFVAIEARVASPLVPRRVFGYRDFSAGGLLALVQAAGYSGMAVYASIYWQQVAHLPPLLTGFAFLPCAVIMAAIVAPASAPLSQRFGPRAVATAGSLVTIAGMAIGIYVTGLTPAWWLMLIVTVVAAVGCMETFELSMIAGLAHVDAKDEGAAAGGISTMGQIGMGLGVAVAAALAMGKPADAGVHDAFWSPFAFSLLTLLVSVFGIGALDGRRGTTHVLRVGKLAFVRRSAAGRPNVSEP